MVPPGAESLRVLPAKVTKGIKVKAEIDGIYCHRRQMLDSRFVFNGPVEKLGSWMRPEDPVLAKVGSANLKKAAAARKLAKDKRLAGK